MARTAAEVNRAEGRAEGRQAMQAAVEDVLRTRWQGPCPARSRCAVRGDLGTLRTLLTRAAVAETLEAFRGDLASGRGRASPRATRRRGQGRG